MAKKQNNIKPPASSDLHSLAEERLKNKHLATQFSRLSTTPSPEEMRGLIHELEVHQIELEMQQEELTRTRIELEKSLGKYTDLYDFAPVGYLTLSRDRKILLANLTATKLLGVDPSRLLGMDFKEFILPKDYRAIDTMLETVFSKRVPGNCEVKVLATASQPATTNSDLAIRTFRIDASVSDTQYACRIILSDITAQMVAEESLRKSEHNFRSITEQMADEVFVIDSIGTLTYVSPVVEKLFGYLPHEVIGHPFTIYLLEEDIPKALQVFNKTLEHKTTNQIFEVKFKRKDSSLFDGEIHLQYYENHDTSGLIGLIHDTSDRKLAELNAQEMNTRYEATIEASQIGTWDWNVQTGEVILNNRWFEIAGYSPEDLAPVSIQTWVDLAHPDDYRDSMAKAEKLFTGEQQYYEHECRMKHKNDTWVWVLDRGSMLSWTADGKPLHMLGTHIDITERKQAETALRESEIKFRSITEQISELVFVTEACGTVNYVSPVIEKLSGYLPDDVIGHSFIEFIAEDDIPRVVETFHDAIAHQLKNQVIEFKYRKKNGTFLDAEVHSQYYHANGFSGVIGVILDVTDRKLAENQIKKLGTIVEQSPAIVLITDRLGKIEYVNPAFTQITGYTFDEVKGKNPRFLQSGLTPKAHYEQLWKTILSGNIWRGEFQNRKKNGALYCERAVISAILKEDVITNFVAIKEDITEHKKEEQLIVESRGKLEAALASMSDAVFISDTKGNLIHFNDAFATFHRFRNKEECAKTFDEYPKFLEAYLLSGELVPVEQWALQRALGGETATGVELRLLRKDSGETWFGSYNYAPIRNTDGRIVGSVVTGRDITKKKAAEQEINSYVKQLQAAMQSTLQAVANVVEAHDPYTAGHERRVGIISADIAREMGWSEEKCHYLQLIGLVHDIGKMSIPAEILSKPSLLSEIEFELVKTHAEQGYQILKDVEFPLPIAEIIREHHERMDGSGYPQGLKGEKTLIEARILAVADVLESMASHRPYRASLGIEEAINEIESYRGKHFDPEVVDAVLRLFRKKGYQLPA